MSSIPHHVDSKADANYLGANLSVPKLTGVEAGDLLIAVVSTCGNWTPGAPPAGFALLSGYPISVGSGDTRLRQYVYTKDAGASEPAGGYTFPVSGTSTPNDVALIVSAYKWARVDLAVSDRNTDRGTRITIPTGTLPFKPRSRWVALLSTSVFRPTEIRHHRLQKHRMRSPLLSGIHILSEVADDIPTGSGHRAANSTTNSKRWHNNAGTLLSLTARNLPPHAPSLTPVAAFDATQARGFSWAFADPNPGDTQGWFQLRVVRASDGVTVYDTGKTAGVNQSHAIPAGTLANGVDHQWRVRTWDQLNTLGPWSDWAAFTTSQRPTVTITTPTAGQVVAAPQLLVAWTYGHPEATQHRRRVELLEGGEVVRDTGWRATAATSFELVDLVHNTAYTVRVTVASVHGLVSAPRTRAFTTDFPGPPVPTVDITTVDDGAGANRLRIAVQNPPPTGTEAATHSNLIYRRVEATDVAAAGPWVRIAEVPPQGVHDDWHAPHGVAVAYRVEAVNPATGPTRSADVPVTPELAGTWLHDVADPDATATRLRGVRARTHRWEGDVDLTRYAGRPRPVAEWGEGGDETVDLDVTMIGYPDRVARLGDLLRRRATLCYRDRAGRVLFVAAPGVDLTDHWVGGADAKIVLHQVDFDETV